jgi:multidrug resistance efflux pump
LFCYSVSHWPIGLMRALGRLLMTVNRTRTGEESPSQQVSIGDLVERLSRFDGPPDQFLINMLAVQCAISFASSGAIVRPGANNQAEVLAVYPPIAQGAPAPAWLSQAAEFMQQVSASGAVMVRPLRAGDEMYGQPADRHMVMLPLRNESGIRGLASFLVESSDPEVLGASRMRLELTLSLLSLYEMRLTLQRRQFDLRRMRLAMEVLSAVNEPDKFAGSGMALCNEIASRWQAHRVGLGFLKGRYVHLKALSHTEKFSRKMKLIQDMEAAMEECLDQDVEVIFPPAADATYVSRASAELSNRQGPSCLMCLPLRRAGEVVGVLSVERPSDKPFALDEVEALRLTSDLVTARMLNLFETDRWIGARLVANCRKGLSTVIGPKHTWIKLIVIAVFAAIMFMTFVKGMYRAEGTCSLESIQRREVPAPFEGKLDKIYGRIGDVVKEGDVLATLQTDELENSLKKAISQKAQYEVDFNQANAESRNDETKLAEAKRAKAQMDEKDAEINLLKLHIAKSSLKAPTDGVITAGDLESKSGAPVKTGDLLFEIAPLDSLRAEISVPEDQINDVVKGATGELATKEHPELKVPFVVERVNPTAEVVAQKNIFKVRVVLQNIQPGPGHRDSYLLPGREAVAKIDIARRSYGWIWTHQLVNWVRMKLWL